MSWSNDASEIVPSFAELRFLSFSAPAHRFAHGSGVESLSWLSDGRLLAVGCQKRNVQLYDLRVSGTNAPPVSVFAHSEAVSGIVPDRNAETVFATFGKNPDEPVKIWDARMMDSALGEIRAATAGRGVSDVAWSPSRPGILSLAVGDSVRTYDTRTPGSRAIPLGVSYPDGDARGSDVRCLAFQPQTRSPSEIKDDPPAVSTNASNPGDGIDDPFRFYPRRTLAVSSRGTIDFLPESYAAPLAISMRDGRIAHGLGGTVWIGSTTDGTSGALVCEVLFRRRALTLPRFRHFFSSVKAPPPWKDSCNAPPKTYRRG